MLSDDIYKIITQVEELLQRTDPDKSYGYVELTVDQQYVREQLGEALEALREAEARQGGVEDEDRPAKVVWAKEE